MNILYLLLWIIILSFVTWIVWSYIAQRWLEEPKYSIISQEKTYEIREYSPYIVAEVEVFWSQQEALNNGFRLLAGYIFGWNTSKASISMTTPVIDTKTNESIKMTTPVIDIKWANSSHTVQFTMPSEYTLETLPTPDDERVKLHEISTSKIAALRFTGWVTEKKSEQKIEKLRTLLLQDGFSIEWNFSLAQYNPPFSFPFMRRNEILVGIE